MKQVAHHIDKKTLRMIGEGMVMSHIRYCLSTYGASIVRIQTDDPTSVMLKHLQILQNKMLRIIGRHRLQDQIPTEQLLKQNNMNSINQMIAYSILMDFWKAKNLDVRPIMSHFEERSSMRYQGHYKNNSDPDSFVSTAAKLWSMAPRRLRTTNLLTVAKKNAIEFVRSRILF